MVDGGVAPVLLLLPAFLDPDLFAGLALFPRVFFLDGAGGVTWKEKHDNVALSFAVKHVLIFPPHLLSLPWGGGGAFLPALAPPSLDSSCSMKEEVRLDVLVI